MKKTFLSIFIIALSGLFMVTSARAQLPAANIETLILDIWPDYDQPNVLVLMTGTLSSNTPLPTTVSIPLHADAEVNAVARVTEDNRMIDDIDYTIANDILTLTTPDSRFRVEYYAPYESNGINHAFTFEWLADVPVESLLAAVQQPTGATNMSVTPANANAVSDTTDGFTYYTFPPETIPAGEPFIITFNYDMVTPQLSVDSLPAPGSTSETNANSGSSTNASSPSGSFSLGDINWLLVIGVLGVILVAVVVTWLVATRQRRPVRKNRKPRPKRANNVTKSSGRAKFCHQCGNKLNANDKFCRECGTAVKGFNN
jgi:hypothetical protein